MKQRNVFFAAITAAVFGWTSASHALVMDLGTASPVSTDLNGLAGPLTFSTNPASDIKEAVTLKNGPDDFKAYFPDQNTTTIATGIDKLFGFGPFVTLTLTLNVETGIPKSSFSATDPSGFNFVAIHNGQGELVFEYLTSQTNFALSGFSDGFSNARFFSARGLPGGPPVSGVPETSTWTMLVAGFLGLGLLAYRNKNRLTMSVA